MECRKVLLSMRKQREEELRAYKVLSAKLHDSHLDLSLDLIKKRQALLTLELPFMTDIVNVNEARLAQAGGIHIDDPNASINAALIKSDRVQDRSYKFEENWSEKKSSRDYHLRQSYVRKSLLNFMRSRKILPAVSINGRSPAETDFDDLRYEAPFQALCQGIEQCELQENTKKIYLSQLKKMRTFILGTNYNQHKPALIPGVSLYGLAGYFEYLEVRCLKSCSINHYQNLLEIRLHLYVDLPYNKLSHLTFSNIDIKSKVLNYQNVIYPIPLSFIELSKSLLADGEPFLKKNAKQQDKFVSQTSQAKKANIQEKITPLVIKKSLAFIYQSEGFFCAYLPHR